MIDKRAVIFANGHLPDAHRASGLVKPGDVLIAADGGTQHMLAMGLTPSVIIGDLDSLPLAMLETIKPNPTVFQHPRDKEETDLELALQYALDQGYSPIRIVAALGGRLDQTLGNLSLLTATAWQEHDIRLDDGLEEVFFTRTKAEWLGEAGDIVSLLPWGAPVHGVITNGLKWQLSNEILAADKTRGISNEMLGGTASVQITTGLLLIIHSRRFSS
jgi:thiamine pyrophosphokinase